MVTHGTFECTDWSKPNLFFAHATHGMDQWESWVSACFTIHCMTCKDVFLNTRIESSTLRLRSELAKNEHRYRSGALLLSMQVDMPYHAFLLRVCLVLSCFQRNRQFVIVHAPGPSYVTTWQYEANWGALIPFLSKLMSKHIQKVWG